MNQKVDCALVKDLLPNYMEHLTSDTTNQYVEGHLEECSECSSEYEMMKSNIEILKESNHLEFKNYLSRTKSIYLLKGVLIAIFSIGILVTFIVDLATSRHLTWSLIVDAGIFYAVFCMIPLFICKHHKILGSIISATILILPLLACIQGVQNKYYASVKLNWFGIYAVPICILWIAIIWVTVLAQKIWKINLWITFSFLLFLSIFGTLYTNAFSNGVTVMTTLVNDYKWIDCLAYFGGSVLFLIVGILWNKKTEDKLKS